MAGSALRLSENAREAVTFDSGEAADKGSRTVPAPAAVDVRATRAALNMSQTQFAAAFGFPVGTLRDWEQGRVCPDMATRSYLRVIGRRPEAVREALASA